MKHIITLKIDSDASTQYVANHMENVLIESAVKRWELSVSTKECTITRSSKSKGGK